MNHTDVLLKQGKGFTLIEMAMVLLIVGLLLGGLVPTISGQIERQRTSETGKQLNEIKEALIGYAVINGRLPCPASSSSNAVEVPVGGGSCTSFDGFVPASTLGLSGTTDSSGFAIDSWGNRIRYAVTTGNGNAFTTANGMKTTTISLIVPDLLVCSTGTGISAATCAAGTSLTSNGVPAIIFSTGKNGASGGTGTDEAANLDGNQTFVSHTSTPSGSTNGEFDDIVTWISPNVLINRMVAAGQLP